MNNGKNNLTVAMISEHGDPLAPLGGQQSGGQNVYVYELARALGKLGVKVDVFTRWDNRKSAQVVRFGQRSKVIRLKAGHRHFISKDNFGPLMPEFVEKMLEYARINKRKYNLIHSHYYFSGWAGLQCKYILQIPLIHTFHSLGLIKKRALGIKDTSPTERTKTETEIMKHADVIISTSPQEKIDMIDCYHVNAKNTVVIPCGANLRRFSPLNKIHARKKLGLSLKNNIIVFAGKMERRKGGLTLVAAVKEIKRRWPAIYNNLDVYMFSGDPRRSLMKESKENNDRKDLEEAIVNNKVDDKIKLMPGIEQEELHYYYGAADVVVMPSYYEPFGMVAIEAMATGTPVVASDVGGLKWTIEDGITGFHAEVKNSQDFARKIIKILKNPDLAARMGQNAIIHSRQNYNWQTIAQNVLKVYKKTIKCK